MRLKLIQIIGILWTWIYATEPQTIRDVTIGASGVELTTKMAVLLQDAFRRHGIPGDLFEAKSVRISGGDLSV